MVAANGSHTPHMILNSTEVTEVKTILSIFSSDLAIAVMALMNGHPQGVRSLSNCHIDSLGVYRGRNRIIEVSHDGFDIAEGTIEVNALHPSLKYSSLTFSNLD